MEPSTILSIPCHVFTQWVTANPDVAINIFATIGTLLDGAYARILDVIDESVETRILNALNMLSTRIGSDLPLTNVDVAELVGTSRESAARVISHLQEKGLIAKSRGTIRILDQDRLEEASSNSFFIL